MIQILSTPAREGSTYKITVAFKDENGDALEPTTATYTVTRPGGAIVNSLEDVDCFGGGAAASSADIVLTGDDLAIEAGERGSRVLRTVTVTAEVSSKTYIDAVAFEILALEAVS